MSCDTNRGKFFRIVGPRIQPAFGTVVPADELLELVYDVTVNQEHPADRAARLAAVATVRAMRKRSLQDKVDLHPHIEQMRPEVEATWVQIYHLLTAIEERKPLPPLAADCFQSLAFQKLVNAPGVAPWNPPMARTTRLGLRQAWAGEPAALERALGNSPVGPEYDAFLGAMSTWLTLDDAVPPDLAAAARHYLICQDADALSDDERGAWAGVLARAAGLGIGGDVDEQREATDVVR